MVIEATGGEEVEEGGVVGAEEDGGLECRRSFENGMNWDYLCVIWAGWRIAVLWLGVGEERQKCDTHTQMFRAKHHIHLGVDVIWKKKSAATSFIHKIKKYKPTRSLS